MEELIRQAFMHVDVIGPHVAEGHYDLIGHSNEIILPGVWESVIEPDWTITMHMWPMPEPKEEEPPPIEVPEIPPPEPEEPKKRACEAFSFPQPSHITLTHIFPHKHRSSARTRHSGSPALCLVADDSLAPKKKPPKRGGFWGFGGPPRPKNKQVVKKKPPEE